jgi:hypothetical protein
LFSPHIVKSIEALVDDEDDLAHEEDVSLVPQTPQTPRRAKKADVESLLEPIKEAKTDSYLEGKYAILPRSAQERLKALADSRTEHYHHGSRIIRERASNLQDQNQGGGMKK